MTVEGHVIAARPANGVDQRSLREPAPGALTLPPPDRFDLIPEKGIDAVALAAHQAVRENQHLQAPIPVRPPNHREGARKQNDAEDEQLERLEGSARSEERRVG